MDVCTFYIRISNFYEVHGRENINFSLTLLVIYCKPKNMNLKINRQ